MSFQDKSIQRTAMQNKILDMEQKYFDILAKVFSSESFIDDLLTIEKEIRENYPKFKDTWNLKNKLKVPAERLVRHHVYTQLHELITGIYPSPISSDLGIMTEDCVLCIDVKTVDTVGNSVDIKSTQVEPNQISFLNTNHDYIQTQSNLESIDHYSRVPVLTYVVKIIYTDDNYSFKLSRNDKPTIVVACIPNGELSNLFGNDIIKNFKTYEYYTESDRPEFAVHYIPKEYRKEDHPEYVRRYCVDEKGFMPLVIESDSRSKDAYYDVAHRVIWWLTSDQNKPAIKAVKAGSTARLDNEILKQRYNSNGGEWIGYKEMTIHNEKA